MPGGAADKKSKLDESKLVEVERDEPAPIEGVHSAVQKLVAGYLDTPELRNVTESSPAKLADPAHSGFAEALRRRKEVLKKSLYDIRYGSGEVKFDALLLHMADYKSHSIKGIPTGMIASFPATPEGADNPTDVPNVLRDAIYSKIERLKQRWSTDDAVAAFRLIKEIFLDRDFHSEDVDIEYFDDPANNPLYKVTCKVTLTRSAAYRHHKVDVTKENCDEHDWENYKQHYEHLSDHFLYYPTLYLTVARFGENPSRLWRGSIGQSVKVFISSHNGRLSVFGNGSARLIENLEFGSVAQIVRSGKDGTEVVRDDAFDTALKKFDEDMEAFTSFQNKVGGAGKALLELIETSQAEIIPENNAEDESMNPFVDTIVWAMCQSGRPFRTKMTADEEKVLSLRRQILNLTEEEQTIAQNIVRHEKREYRSGDHLPPGYKDFTYVGYRAHGLRTGRDVLFASPFVDRTII